MHINCVSFKDQPRLATDYYFISDVEYKAIGSIESDSK